MVIRLMSICRSSDRKDFKGPFSSVEAARKRSGSDTSKTNLPSTDSNTAVVVPSSGWVELLAALEDLTAGAATEGG